MRAGDMVKWWIPDKMGDKKFGLVIRLDERSGRPGAWVMWNDNQQPMWTPKEMLMILGRNAEETCHEKK
jgi:hypothetical protein